MRAQGVEFTVAGIPAPQGSKVRTRYGMREDNPATKPWRSAVAWEATAAMTGRPAFVGPVTVNVRLYFPRPKGHYGTGRNANTIKTTAPAYCATKPDLDKLVRAIGDAITGIVVRDDSQIVSLHALKLYGTPSAVVYVEELP